MNPSFYFMSRRVVLCMFLSRGKFKILNFLWLSTQFVCLNFAWPGSFEQMVPFILLKTSIIYWGFQHFQQSFEQAY